MSSLRLTVVLLALATFLVFAGTLAQIDQSIWTVVDSYFRCAFVWIDLALFVLRDWNVPGGFWFPGGWLIGGCLFLNVVAAHLVRFKLGATGGRRLAGFVCLAAGVALTWLIVAGAFAQDVAATEDAAFWRVLFRLGKGGGAAVVLLIACLLLFGRRRGGVVLLHGGIILLFLAEFITGTSAVEGRMRIPEGASRNYVEHTRMAELVFIDRSDPAGDRVAGVRMDRLRTGGIVRDDALPVDVEVVQFMPNSEPFETARVPMAAANPATTGSGQWVVCAPALPVSGTATEQTVDIPALYVTFRRRADGTSLGTWLMTPWLERSALERQVLTVDGRSYDVALRFARSYKPYSLELIEFRHDVYVGTTTPKNFSSVVRLVDPEAGVDRTVRIWMNNPLRYRGETFYQSSYEGTSVTILQVVRNDGWMLPYLSCMFVAVGMSLHMGHRLFAFLRRKATP